MVVVAERSEVADLDLLVVDSADLVQKFEVAEGGFLLSVTLPKVSKVAAWFVDWVCKLAEEWVSRFLTVKPRLGDHHPPY